MEEQKREFTGIWIPRYIIEDKSLKPVDRLIYAEISCFDLCTMTNKTLGDRAGCSEDTASRSVSRLKNGGYIHIVGFNGRVRKMRSLHIVPPQNAEAASAKTSNQPPQNKAQDNNIENNENITIAKAIGETPAEYGDSEINDMFSYWEKSVGYKIESRKQANRYACKNLITKYNEKGVKQLIDAVAVSQTDKYAPRVSDFATLQSKINEFIAWGKRKTATTSNNVAVI